MADPGSIDDFLSSEIDENAVNALVGSLETQLASPASTQASKPLTDSSYNNNHIGGTTPSSSVRPHFHSNQTVTPNQKGSVSNSISLNAHSPVSTPKLSNAEILGISSIINSSSTPVCGGGVSHVNVNTSISSNGSRTDGQKVSTPTIRIVTQSSSTPVSSTNSAQFITSGGGVISQTSVPSGATNNVHAVHVSSMGAVTRTNATAASSTIYNLATIAAEQKPHTVVHNGSAHPIQVTKDRAVIPQQGFIVKQEGGATLAIKQEGVHANQQFIVKQEGNTPVHIKQDPGVAHSGTLVNTTLKGVAGVSNPSIITVRAHPHPQQVTVVQQPAVVTTQANMTQSMQVVNVSGMQGTPRLANVAPSMGKPGVRVSTPVRITQQPNIAPRQPLHGSSNPVTIPHGTLLMRNEQGQLMIVQTGGPGQPGGASLHPNIITTTSVPITTSSGMKMQRPVTTTLPRPGGGTIVIQPGGQTRGQPVTLTQPPTPRVISQPTPTMPAPSIAQPQPAAVPELNKMMLENVKKCKNFLSTLLKLAANQPASTVKNVQGLIQGLIDSKVEPENFTHKLQHELKSSPQPYLVPFLKKSLPMLRQSMQLGKMSIEGIRPPPHDVVIATPSSQTTQATIQRPQIMSQQTTVVRPPMKGGVVMAAASPLQTKPLVQQQAMVRPPLSQLGPASSKFHMQAAKPSTSVAPPRAKGGASAAVTAALQAHAQKVDTASTAGHKEKRKFEALKEDNDDINDVATMGGVNISEESKNILATNSELIGSQIRSCQDKTFLPHDLLMARIAAVAKKHGLEGVSPDVTRIVSHATQERLRDLISKLSTIAEHRMEIYKMDSRYEVSSDVRGKLKFLEELDKLEKKRHEEQEREMLLRAIKSRSKNEDPEQLKLKQKAKELQQAEAEEVRQREANLTALRAIGPRKKRKLDEESGQPGSSGPSSLPNGPGTPSNRQSVIGRPRIKRVTNRDMQFLMEQDRHLCKSPLLYRTFLK
ncbi:transcription initiation factor TFIID subunit 4-like isoform X2 [Littorina saxatilis]|uniref:transcription initiation factor TFIID subunit 4-like isoform X2 n=1 Tax=Littorina saxatilis TaxID=31220 RepID=UPI0038B67F7D